MNTRTTLTQIAAEPIPKKRVQSNQTALVVFRQFLSKRSISSCYKVNYVQRQLLFHQHADQTQCMAPQRKRVAVPCRQVANAEHAHQGFQLVGQRHGHTHSAPRQRVAGKAWLVVVFNGVGHGLGQSIVERVVAAHGALQLGELADHVGHEIGLGQQCGLVGLVDQGAVAQLLRNGFGY